MSAGDDIFYADIAKLLGVTYTKPLCILRKSTLPVAVATGGAAMTWDLEDADTHGWHSTVTNTSRITPIWPTPLWVTLTFTVHFAPSATGRRSAGIRVNGGTTNYGANIGGTSAGNHGATVTKRVLFNGSTDYAEAFAFQDSGGNLNAVDGTSTVFEAEMCRPQ